MGSDEGRYFEEWLALELRHAISAERGPRPRPAQARYASRTGGSRLAAIRSGILAALGTKAAAGGAIAALAVGGGAVAAAHATGSTDPANWGQHMVQVVESCKNTVRESGAASASRGIGGCVSAAATQHGEQQGQHGDQDKDQGTPASPRPGEREGQESPRPGNGQGGNGGGGSGNGSDRSRSNPHASPAPSPSPDGHGQGGQGGHGQPTSAPTS